MEPREHIETAEGLVKPGELQGKSPDGFKAMLDLSELHLRIAEVKIELARLERPNPAAAALEELLPLARRHFTPPEYFTAAPAVCPGCGWETHADGTGNPATRPTPPDPDIAPQGRATDYASGT